MPSNAGINRLKRHRAVTTRYGELAVRYEATVLVAVLNEWDVGEPVAWVRGLHTVTVFATYASVGRGVLRRVHTAGLGVWDLVVDQAHRTAPHQRGRAQTVGCSARPAEDLCRAAVVHDGRPAGAELAGERIEMRLVARTAQTVKIPAQLFPLDFAEGEELRTEDLGQVPRTGLTGEPAPPASRWSGRLLGVCAKYRECVGEVSAELRRLCGAVRHAA